MKKKIIDIFIILFAIVFIVCGVKLFIEYTKSNEEDQAFQELKEVKEEVDPFEQNEDMYAWLKVEGTYIDYPVMQTPDDPEFYLHADFNKEYSYSGTPFLDYRCDEDSDNLVIYGHNMLNGTMFSTLSYYEEESFFKEYGTIELKTRNEKRKYQVMAAFKTDVKDAMYIYNFIQAVSISEYDEFVSYVKNESIYDTGVTAEAGDELITLSTCAYHVENGRFIVVGKRIK